MKSGEMRGLDESAGLSGEGPPWGPRSWRHQSNENGYPLIVVL